MSSRKKEEKTPNPGIAGMFNPQMMKSIMEAADKENERKVREWLEPEFKRITDLEDVCSDFLELSRSLHRQVNILQKEISLLQKNSHTHASSGSTPQYDFTEDCISEEEESEEENELNISKQKEEQTSE